MTHVYIISVLGKKSDGKCLFRLRILKSFVTHAEIGKSGFTAHMNMLFILRSFPSVLFEF